MELFDESCEDLKGDLNISAKRGRLALGYGGCEGKVSIMTARRTTCMVVHHVHGCGCVGTRHEGDATYPMRKRQTSLAVFFSRKAPIFWILERRLVA